MNIYFYLYWVFTEIGRFWFWLLAGRLAECLVRIPDSKKLIMMKRRAWHQLHGWEIEQTGKIVSHTYLRTGQEETPDCTWHQVPFSSCFLQLNLWMLFVNLRTVTPSPRGIWSPPSHTVGWKLILRKCTICFALIMYMSIVQVPRLELYWSTKQLFHRLWARSFTSKLRYKQIQCFLRVSDHNRVNREDRLTKVKFFFTEYIRRKCMKLWQPNENISIMKDW